ncbi:unnamed protein product [Dibothriocephalus latus]|uniref:Uncharacterized protein n=1 Tax=Dibothriocephalus latus TaxID=60516 RepID=A0A3P6U6C5_DIBLA|nr:unnamed protein product [Dibothriocephalus latus]
MPNKSETAILVSHVFVSDVIVLCGRWREQNVSESDCVIAFSSFLYYLCYAPLVYVLFLRGYLSSRKGHFAFLYRSDLYRSQDVGLSVNSGDITVPSYMPVTCHSDPPTPLPSLAEF